jgi:uncharacterized protein with PIN domain
MFFIFIAVVSKAILAAITIYLLFPTDRQCNNCGGEMVLLQMGPVARSIARLLRGRLQRRWCPRCGEATWARSRPEPHLPQTILIESPVRTRH